MVTSGTWMMPQWSVSSWAVGLLLELLDMDTLGQDLAPFGWMMFSVVAPSLPCLTVHTVDGVKITVVIILMLE